RLIGNNGVYTEAAGVRASEAADHRNHLYEGRLLESGLDELPPLSNAGKRRRLLTGCQAHTDRPMLSAILQQVADDFLIGKSQHVIEVLHRVLRIAAGVGSADCSYCTSRLKKVAERVGELGRRGTTAASDNGVPGESPAA